MSWTYSLELAALALALNEPECEPLPSARSTRSAGEFSQSAGLASPAMTTFGHLPPIASEQTELLPMSSAEDSPVRTSAQAATELALAALAPAYGESTPELLANFDLDTSLWRTSQHCWVEGLTSFWGPWPRSGTMQSGTAYRLPPLASPTRGTVSGLLPTPRHCDGAKGAGARKDGGGAYGLGYVVARLLGLKQQTTTKFDPGLSELLMGFPIMWTSLPASAIQSSRKSRKRSGEQS